MLDIILLAGAVAWLTTALVIKYGPFGILKWTRTTLTSWLGEGSPLSCFHCTSFWVGLVLVIVFYLNYPYTREVIQFFGILGIAQALRGASAEYS